jgi:hypothetical protein
MTTLPINHGDIGWGGTAHFYYRATGEKKKNWLSTIEYFGQDGRNLAEWSERLNANARVATVLVRCKEQISEHIPEKDVS